MSHTGKRWDYRKGKRRTHRQDRLRRTSKLLLRWRASIVSSFKEVSTQQFSESMAEKVAADIEKDWELLMHIDELIMAAAEILEERKPVLEPVPEPTVKKFPPPEPQVVA